MVDELPYCNAAAGDQPWLFPYKTPQMSAPYYQSPCLSFDNKEVVYPADEVSALAVMCVCETE